MPPFLGEYLHAKSKDTDVFLPKIMSIKKSCNLIEHEPMTCEAEFSQTINIAIFQRKIDLLSLMFSDIKMFFFWLAFILKISISKKF